MDVLCRTHLHIYLQFETESNFCLFAQGFPGTTLVFWQLFLSSINDGGKVKSGYTQVLVAWTGSPPLLLLPSPKTGNSFNRNPLGSCLCTRVSAHKQVGVWTELSICFFYKTSVQNHTHIHTGLKRLWESAFGCNSSRERIKEK